MNCLERDSVRFCPRTPAGLLYSVLRPSEAGKCNQFEDISSHQNLYFLLLLQCQSAEQQQPLLLAMVQQQQMKRALARGCLESSK